MVKQRMTALDVRATVEEMRASLVGLRLLNIYNISNKMFLFKFGHGENKRSVILENGIRFHLTELAREKPKIPSQFTLKLRKHIRAWRLDTITQLQHDRTVDLCFGVASTEGCFHIIVELFSKGNVILTDHNYKMMMLLRTHRDDEGLNLAVNAIYPISAPFAAGAAAGGVGGGGGGGSTSPSATASVAAGSVSGSTVAATAVEEPHVMLYAPHVDAAGHLHVKHIAEADLTPSQRTLKQERIRSMKAEWDVGVSRATEWTVLQALVSSIRHFGPDLAQHVLTVAGVPNAQMKAWTVSPDDMFAQLVEALLEAYDLAKVDLTSAGGYLIKKAPAKAAFAAAAEDEATAAAAAMAGDDHSAAAVTVAVAEQYESFTPILLAQYTKTSVESLYRQSFGRVCDEFFLITETEKIDVSNSKRSNVAKNKESKFAADHARRINGLEADIAKNHLKGEQLILNAERVDEAIQLINGALATGISWDALRTLLKRRNAEGHPVAYMIHDLFLERNSISVLLEAQLEEDEEDCDVPPMVVEVSLAKTAHANAADYFGQKKQNASKLERTVAATAKAAAGAARKGARKAAEQKEKKAIVKERQRNWWEKFFWFRTSAGDLVLRGKDVQSTELLLRRVKKLGDLFIQCEVDGSLPCLLRPMAGLWQQGSADGGEAAAAAAAAASTQPVAAASLCEAGAWCVAFSGAWESKQSTGAWWIYASQVTGGSAAGMYVFSGERNYLPPQPMSLSCALLFYVTRTIDQVGDSTRATTTTVSKEEEGRGEEGTVAEASPVDGVVEAVTPAAAADILRCELPHLPTKAQLLAAAAAAATTKGSSETTAQGEVGSAAAHLASAMDGLVPADTATALADMPTVEELRADQRRQQQSYTGGGGGKASSSYSSSNAAGKGKKGGYARNARVDRAALQGNSNSVAVSVVASEAAAHARTPSVTTTATTATTAAAAAAQGKAAMSKHQKKKLKKIQDKYGDQDEEDRALGAQVNGNQLSRVQLLELERLAALRQAEEEAKRKAEAMAARRAAQHGRNASSSSSSSSCDDEKEDEEVEVVSDFSDEDDEGNAAAAHSVSPPPPLAPSMDDLAGDSEREEAASPTIPSPTHKNSDDDDEEEKEDHDDVEGAGKEEATQGRGARAARNDHEAAVAQQTAELHRAFPHYTMRPTAGDVVQHVVAVCAPMMTVSEYAYQVPLAMGNAKKGVLAAKLLQVFTERAETGTAGAAGSRKTQRKAAKAHADPSSAIGATAAAAEAAQINPTLVQALKMTSPTDVVEQLRANVKPVEFRV